MQLTQVTPTRSMVRLQFHSTFDSFSWDRCDHDGLLCQAEKKLSTGLRSPTVEPKRILIEIVVQMFRLDSTLVGAQKPPLEEGNDKMARRQRIISDISHFANDLVPISSFRHLIVAIPAIRPNLGSKHNIRFDTWQKTISRGILYSTKANSAHGLLLSFTLIFHRNYYQSLVLGTSASFAGPFATYIRLVDFHSSGQTITPRPYHCPTDTVQPFPGSVITPKPQNPLKTQGICSILLARNVPHRSKPKNQWFPSPMEDTSCGNRRLMTATGAVIQIPVCCPRFPALASRAHKPFRPSQVEQILPTCHLRRKSFLKFQHVSRIVFHTRKHYILGLLESTAYPSKYNFLKD